MSDNGWKRDLCLAVSVMRIHSNLWCSLWWQACLGS